MFQFCNISELFERYCILYFYVYISIFLSITLTIFTINLTCGIFGWFVCNLDIVNFNIEANFLFYYRFFVIIVAITNLYGHNLNLLTTNLHNNPPRSIKLIILVRINLLLEVIFPMSSDLNSTTFHLLTSRMDSLFLIAVESGTEKCSVVGGHGETFVIAATVVEVLHGGVVGVCFQHDLLLVGDVLVL